MQNQDEEVKRNQKLKSTGFRRWLLRILKVLVLVAALWLVFVLMGRALCQIAVAQIIELTNTKIKAKSVDFNFDGSVFIEKLAVKPHKSQKHDDTILKAETVYARFSTGSLLLLRPRLKEIRVNDFVFNAQYDLDTDRWNISALKIKVPESGLRKMPLVRLEKGILQYSKVSNGQVKAVAAVPIDARFGSAGKTQHRYSFNITTAERAGFGKSVLVGSWQPGRITIAGGISSADVPAFEKAWTINVLAAELNYDQSNTYSLRLIVKDLLGTHSPAGDTFAFDKPPFLEKFGLFTALQRFFNRYKPAGQVDIDLKASGNLQQLTESILRGKVYCRDVSIIDRKFPYPVEHITGLVNFTEKSFELQNLIGRHGDVKVTFNGCSEDFGPNRQYRIQITSDNMALDDDLYNALSTKHKKLWSLFSPSGLAAINYCLYRQPQMGKKKALAVELLGAEATYRHFPYPLKNLTGTLLFAHDSIIIPDVASQWDERGINFSADLEKGDRDTGSLTTTKDSITLTDITATTADNIHITPNAPTIKINGEIALADNAFRGGLFTLSANDIVFDERVGIALPEHIQPFYQKLSPTGRFDLDFENIRIFNAADGKKYVDLTGVVEFKDCNFNVSPGITELDAVLKIEGLYKTGSRLCDGRAALIADGIKIKGRVFTGLKADIYYDHHQKSWLTKNLIADCYGGRLTGKFEFRRHADRALEYLLQIGFSNIDLKQFPWGAKSKETSNSGHTSGRMSGSLSVTRRIDGGTGHSYQRIGRCRLQITDMQVGKASLLAKLLHVLKLTQPKDFAYDRMLVDSYIKNSTLFLEHLDLSGQALAFSGSGWMNLQSKDLDLTLFARGHRLATAEPSILQSLAEDLSLAIVRIEVTGNLYDPQVTPTSFPLVKETLEILGTKPTTPD
jgi:hypothetical protein